MSNGTIALASFASWARFVLAIAPMKTPLQMTFGRSLFLLLGVMVFMGTLVAVVGVDVSQAADLRTPISPDAGGPTAQADKARGPQVGGSGLREGGAQYQIRNQRVETTIEHRLSLVFLPAPCGDKSGQACVATMTTHASGEPALRQLNFLQKHTWNEARDAVVAELQRLPLTTEQQSHALASAAAVFNVLAKSNRSAPTPASLKEVASQLGMTKLGLMHTVFFASDRLMSSHQLYNLSSEPTAELPPLATNAFGEIQNAVLDPLPALKLRMSTVYAGFEQVLRSRYESELARKK